MLRLEMSGAPPTDDEGLAPFDLLVKRATAAVAPGELSPSATCGTVGAAIETAGGDIFVGVCVDTSSSLGFCAEHAAAAAMLTAGQNVVVRMVAVNRRYAVLAPCGRCREFISQLSPHNLDAEVLVPPHAHGDPAGSHAVPMAID